METIQEEYVVLLSLEGRGVLEHVAQLPCDAHAAHRRHVMQTVNPLRVLAHCHLELPGRALDQKTLRKYDPAYSVRVL
jgi:hypothetical protein